MVPCMISSVLALTSPPRKFGKQIQRRQLDLPEYAASFVNYKALKKVGIAWDRRLHLHVVEVHC